MPTDAPSRRSLNGRALVLGALMLPAVALAAAVEPGRNPWLWPGLCALVVFTVAYLLVLAEEITGLRKSKPVVVAAGVVWILASLQWQMQGIPGIEHELKEALSEFSELFLFLLTAMTFVSALEERRVFDVLRTSMLRRRLGLRSAFWLTGIAAFALSPLIDNLTTALVIGAVALAIGVGETRFVAASCINIVVAANAGGAFSPFGDVTTLMVWQRGHIPFAGFLALFLPSLVNWLVPAGLLSLSIPRRCMEPVVGEQSSLKPGAVWTISVFAATIALTVFLHQALHLPPFLGMMTGLGCLGLLGRLLRRTRDTSSVHDAASHDASIDLFRSLKGVEWDTLLFFYGVMLCVSGLAALGFLNLLSGVSYGALGATGTHTLVGIASAIVDNVPVMSAILAVEPNLPAHQWLLVTLTTGVGGSLLSIGSAAGIALMGQARGIYTFGSHLRWSWAVLLGYAASIATHLYLTPE